MESSAGLRPACLGDSSQLMQLWSLLFDQDDAIPHTPWKLHAREWLARYVDDSANAHFPVVEVDGELVATAIGALENGVPNPHCPKGRTVRLANLITLPGHRRRGYGTMLARDVIAWARTVDADRVDLSASPQGQRIYAQLGFTVSVAPRMKLVF